MIYSELLLEKFLKNLVYSGPSHSIDLLEKSLGMHFKINAVEPTSESLLPAFEKCTVFLDASMKVSINEQHIAASSSLELIATATTGATHINSTALEVRGIPLLTLKGQTSVLHSLTPAAELTWALIMACARHLRAAIHHVEGGRWERTEFPGLMLKDKTIGIIGLGRIGGWVARYANAFDMQILAYDPVATEFPDYVKKVSLEELVAESDVITIHVHVTEKTEGMLNKEIINHFKEGSVFVNTSRAELTDEYALVSALESGHIAALGVDVLMGEPEIENNPIWQYAQTHENVHITPHIGGFCPDAVKKVVGFAATRILDYFKLS